MLLALTHPALAVTTILCCSSAALTRLVVVIVAISARDENRSRPDRALDALRLLRRDSQLPPGDGSSD
jgi:hypothetical protein